VSRRRPWTTMVLALLQTGLLGACVNTEYVDWGAAPDEPPLGPRQVEYVLDTEFYRDPPFCAVVLPIRVNGRPVDFSDVIERTLARHLAGRLDRVIGPQERDHLERKLAVDLSDDRDRRIFARLQRCGHMVEAEPWRDGDTYALFWSEARIGLDVRMRRARDGFVVWRARHTATRTEGGLPTSFLSAAFNLFAAGSQHADPDVRLSVADDAVRRIVVSLPDTRLVQ